MVIGKENKLNIRLNQIERNIDALSIENTTLRNEVIKIREMVKEMRKLKEE